MTQPPAQQPPTPPETPPTSGRLVGKHTLVTGASRGFGRALALALAKEGAHVIAMARRAGGLEDLDDTFKERGYASPTLIPLDLTKLDRIDALGPTLFERFGKLDIFIGNAAQLGLLSPLGHIQADVWDMVLKVNLTANWRLIRTLDPVLRASGEARAVFVTSGAASGDKAYWGPYAASKAGLEALVKTYARETASTDIRVNLFNPGPMRTAMREKAFPGEDTATLTMPDALTEDVIRLCLPDCSAHGEVVSGLADNSVSA